MGDNMRVVNVSRPSDGVRRFDCAIEVGRTTVGDALVASGYIKREDLPRLSIQMNGAEVDPTALAEDGAKFVVSEREPVPVAEDSEERGGELEEDASPTFSDEMDDFAESNDDAADTGTEQAAPVPPSSQQGTPTQQEGPGFVKIVCIPGSTFPVEVKPGDTLRSVLQRSGRIRIGDVDKYEITIDKQPATLDTRVVPGNLVVMTDKISGA